MRVVVLLFVLACVFVSGGESNTHDLQTCQPNFQGCGYYLPNSTITYEGLQTEHVLKITHGGTVPKPTGILQRVYNNSILNFLKWLRKRVNKLFFKKK